MAGEQAEQALVMWTLQGGAPAFSSYCSSDRQMSRQTQTRQADRESRKEAAGVGGGAKEGGGNDFGVFRLRGDQVTWKMGLWRPGPWLHFEGQAPDEGR